MRAHWLALHFDTPGGVGSPHPTPSEVSEEQGHAQPLAIKAEAGGRRGGWWASMSFGSRGGAETRNLPGGRASKSCFRDLAGLTVTVMMTPVKGSREEVE